MPAAKHHQRPEGYRPRDRYVPQKGPEASQAELHRPPAFLALPETGAGVADPGFPEFVMTTSCRYAALLYL